VPAFASAAKQRAQAVLGFDCPLFIVNAPLIAELSLKHRLPGIYYSPHYPTSGCLMSYGASVGDVFRRAATYVDISKHVGRVNRESIVVDEIVG
jgi:putative ABC transport system substrate-binding protein